MRSITRKGDIKIAVEHCLLTLESSGSEAFVAGLNDYLLSAKIKFPLLEYCAAELFEAIPYSKQLEICDEIEKLETIGGNVLLGMILQKRLNNDFKQSISKAAAYIENGDAWHVTDIIGERVYGWSLLHAPGQTLEELKKLARHPSHWVVRSIGAGSHYALKKGLDKKSAEAVFCLLLSLAGASDYHIKTGIGWAAKTTAKFHPDIIQKYQAELNAHNVGAWFRRKVKIGLERNTYAQTRRR